MTCREFLSRHSEYVDALIEPGDAARLRSHAESCGSCARYDHVVRRGAELARDLLRPLHAAEDFAPRVRHRLYHVRDEMSRAREGSASVFAAVASVILLAAATALALAVEADADPTLDAAAAWASAPPAYTPLRTKALAVRSVPALPVEPVGAADVVVASIEAEAEAKDPHVASSAGWPVYSRGAVAVAFPGSHASLVVTPADFRPTGAERRSAGPLLVRH